MRRLAHLEELDSWISLDRAGEPQKSTHGNFISILRRKKNPVGLSAV
jgi:hypothetical protein